MTAGETRSVENTTAFGQEDTEIVLKIHEAQIRQLYRQTWNGLAGSFIVALLDCIALWQVLPHWKLMSWGGLMVLLIVARVFLLLAFQRKSPAGHAIYGWARWHVIGSGAAALLWGLPALLLWPADSPVHQMIWPICIVAVSAAAIATYCSWIPSCVVFLVFSILPISFRLLWEDGLVYCILGLLGLLFTAIIGQTGRAMNAAGFRALDASIRNEALNGYLLKEKAKAEELNGQLKKEVVERQRSQAELYQRNGELEILNSQLNETKNRLESANKELEFALVNVKQLSGMLPICSSCKKIRNDEGYWEQIEAYIRDHSEVNFSHGICPGCAEKLYPTFYKRKQ